MIDLVSQETLKGLKSKIKFTIAEIINENTDNILSVVKGELNKKVTEFTDKIKK